MYLRLTGTYLCRTSSWILDHSAKHSMLPSFFLIHTVDGAVYLDIHVQYTQVHKKRYLSQRYKDIILKHSFLAFHLTKVFTAKESKDNLCCAQDYFLKSDYLLLACVSILFYYVESHDSSIQSFLLIYFCVVNNFFIIAVDIF